MITEKLKIWYDNEQSSPRIEYDNLSTFVSCNRFGEYGDDNAIEKLKEEMKATGKISQNVLDNLETKGARGVDELLEYGLKTGVIAAYKRLYVYKHSGETIATTPFHCRFDSWGFGFAYVTKEELRNEYNVKRVTKKIIEKAESIIDGEVETYDLYLTDGWYGFSTIDEEGDVKDSCGGFLGNDWKSNGMKEHLSKEYHELLEDAFDNVEY